MMGYMFHGNHGQITPPVTDRGVGWYDTGDIVTVDDDRYVRILGRAKRFAKIAGEMVSLSMVEELASSVWPEKLHGAVAMPDPRKGEQIILLTDADGAQRKALADAAKARGLSELTIPRSVHVVAQVPVLGTGKLDYRALADLASSLHGDADNE